MLSIWPMLTKEQNELLCRVEGDAADGADVRRHWLPVCMAEEVAEADGAPVRARLLGEDLVVFRDTAGQTRCSGRALPASPRVARLRAQRGVRPALPLPRLEIRRRRQRRRHALRSAGRRGSAWARRPRPIRRARAAASSGSGWARARRCASSSRPPGRRSPASATRSSRCTPRCNWAQVLEGSIDSAHSSSLHSTNMPAAEGAKAPPRPTRPGCARRPTRRRNCSSRPTELRVPLRGDPQADPQSGDAPVRAHHALHRAVHLPDPAERPVQPGADAHPDRRREHHVLLDRVASRIPKKGISQQAWRRFCGAEVGVDLDRELQKKQKPGEPLPAGPRRDEARRLDRHPRHPDAGHGDVGVDGADLRPQPGPSRRERPRGGAVPPHDGRGGEEVPGRRARASAPRSRGCRTSSSLRSKASCRRASTGARWARLRKSRSAQSNYSRL